MRGIAGSSDFNSDQVLVRPVSDTIYVVVLAASTEDHITIPSGATRVVFGATNVYYVKVGGSAVRATIPGSDVTSGIVTEQWDYVVKDSGVTTYSGTHSGTKDDIFYYAATLP